MTVLNDQDQGGAQATAQTAKDEASGVAGHAKQAAGDLTQTSAEQAKEVASEAKRQARDLAGEARQQLKDQSGQQRQRAASSLRTVGDELRQMADRSETGGLGAELARQASDRAQAFANRIENTEPGDFLEEVRSFARQRPGVFLLGAALAGVAVGRLTRGAIEAHQDDSNGSRPSPTELSTAGGGYDTGYTGTGTGLGAGYATGDLGTTTAGAYDAGAGTSTSYGTGGAYGTGSESYTGTTATDPADTGVLDTGFGDTGVTAAGGDTRVSDRDPYDVEPPLVDEPRRDL